MADGAPGFVWRFQTAAGDATALRPFDDDRILVNFSVWTSAEALHAFVYRTRHADVLRERQQWFERMDQPFTVLGGSPPGIAPRSKRPSIGSSTSGVTGPPRSRSPFCSFPVPSGE